ncbi:MAG: HNH endonuclease [Proteobacteria bacterium]|nr:HNH endonuclease [Pseudomonadota bacterium]
MARTEFSRKTKQEALQRSGLRCEAAGTRYGFEEAQRCNCSLSLGVQYDHAVPDALGGDNSLDNCLAICVQCHRFKTRNDVKQIAKSNRQRDKASGVIRPAGKIKSPGFPKAEKPKKAVVYRPVTFYREDMP